MVWRKRRRVNAPTGVCHPSMHFFTTPIEFAHDHLTTPARGMEGASRARPQARRCSAPHAGRRNKLFAEKTAVAAARDKRRIAGSGGSRHQPLGPRSRRRDDGSGQADDVSAEPRYCALSDWPACSPSDRPPRADGSADERSAAASADRRPRQALHAPFHHRSGIARFPAKFRLRCVITIV